MCVFIILIFLFITFPFITSFVYIVTLIFGEPVSYIAGGIVSNFYIPILAILGFMTFWIMFKFFILNLFINKAVLGYSEIKHPKFLFNKFFVLLIGLIVVLLFSFNSIRKVTNLTLDIQNLSTSNFSKMEGTLQIYEVTYDITTYTYMKIDGLKFEGGYAKGEELVDGEKYQVEYLPHSLYVVKYHRLAN